MVCSTSFHMAHKFPIGRAIYMLFEQEEDRSVAGMNLVANQLSFFQPTTFFGTNQACLLPRVTCVSCSISSQMAHERLIYKQKLKVAL